jgi:hypothetical protein
VESTTRVGWLLGWNGSGTLFLGTAVGAAAQSLRGAQNGRLNQHDRRFQILTGVVCEDFMDLGMG